MTTPGAGPARGPRSQRQAARSAGHAYAAGALALVVALAAVVLTAPRNSVPSIAEIAPQAVAQITEALPEQASSQGRADAGGAAGGDASIGDEAKQQQSKGKANDRSLIDDEGNIDVARVLHCVGEPKRQIEDPQAPPCVPYWPVDADNGGDMSPGIVGGEIRIGVPVKFADAQFQTLEAFFNSRFQLYGRRIRLVDMSDVAKSTDDAVAQQQAAAATAQARKLFASTDYWYNGGLTYMRELAQKHIIGVDYQSIMSDGELAKLSPYIWQYPMGTERQLSNLGEWACKRFTPGAARHAGPTLAGTERKFGVIVFEDFGSHTDVAPLRNELAACGQGGAPVQVIQGESDPETQYSNALLAMSNANVTSVMCVCDSEILGNIMKQATPIGYYPEWIVPTHTENEAVWIKRTYPKEQSEHLFGLSFEPMNRLPGDDPWIWAATENDQAYGWDKFDNPSSYTRQTFLHPLYRALLLLVSGIQMAGPRLSPERFAEALQRTVFPNPDHPIKAGRVGFIGGSHSMTVDGAEWWWANDVVGPYGGGGLSGQGPGTMCYADGGARHASGNWPAQGETLFDGPCVSGDQPATR